MEKLGMRREGTWREHVIRNQRFEDVVEYGILRHEWRA
jgi:RimJ/RimL family protein N-acetyltransferase